MQTRWLKPAFTMLKREKERERERQVHLPSIILAHINLVFKKYNNNREKERKKIPFSVLRIVTRVFVPVVNSCQLSFSL